MTGNLKLLINFVEKFLGTVKFGNDQIAAILGYGDLGNDLLTGMVMTSSQAWLWHRRLSHLNFDTINLLSKNDIVVGLLKLKFIKDHLCSFCELGKAKRKSFHSKLTPSSKRRLQLLHMDLCGSIDGENLDKMKEKGDECILVGYSNQSRAYRVFNKRTRVIMESIHVNFDELPHMASAHNSSDPAPTCQTMASDQISYDLIPECQTMALEHNSLSPGQKCQENVSHGDKTGTTSTELDLLFSPMFDELLNGSSKVLSKSSTISAADAPNERQRLTTPLNNHTTHAPTCQTPTIAPTVISSENINQAETHADNDQVADGEFINIFSTPMQDQGETLSRHVD
uniref:Uncharacterized protein n=1 Tax=Tanacetum cinerariifolium TaxID=118510 RepID=A0A699KW39_TANCI|nr:hypothetical protein [Tanacetum cinerariifolium]